MNTFYTYAHAKPNGPIFYIGKGMGDRAWSKDNRNIHWKRTVAKYGYEVELLAYWENENDAFDHENLLISCFKKIRILLVNMTNGGEGSAGYRWTDEQKAKRPPTTGNKNPMYGRIQSKETREKIAKKAKNRSISDETKAKISLKMKERIFSKEHRKNLGKKSAGGNNAMAKKCLIDGVEYACGVDAGKALNLSKSVISRRCNNSKYQNYTYI